MVIGKFTLPGQVRRAVASVVGEVAVAVGVGGGHVVLWWRSKCSSLTEVFPCLVSRFSLLDMNVAICDVMDDEHHGLEREAIIPR